MSAVFQSRLPVIRPLNSLRRYLLPDRRFALALIGFAGVYRMMGLPAWSIITTVIAIAEARFLTARPWDRSSMWRLAFAARSFRTVSDDAVVLHYDPRIARRHRPADLLLRTRRDLDRMTTWFGQPLPGRPAVFVLPGYDDLARTLGPAHGGGIALLDANAVVVAGERLTEDVRHELAHLFACRWNPLAPPLLSEGITVWVQAEWAGQPIHPTARWWIDELDFELSWLLDAGYLFTEPQRLMCYAAAGSFTGFLLRRHGLDAYRWLYVAARPGTFADGFRRWLGVSFESSELLWRYELRTDGPLVRGAAVSPWEVG